MAPTPPTPTSTSSSICTLSWACAPIDYAKISDADSDINMGGCGEDTPCVTVRSGRTLDSAVMTMWAKSRISHGLLVIEYWLTDQSASVALVSIVLVYHMYL
jgi:hypothetical protein